ncbi:hypothetical protein C8Q75DRAFT_770106 [Abortiporus biennis]|nr:hypothetical protein C8Q75DRAFT_770106 [Abortiporus biennis]
MRVAFALLATVTLALSSSVIAAPVTEAVPAVVPDSPVAEAPLVAGAHDTQHHHAQTTRSRPLPRRRRAHP